MENVHNWSGQRNGKKLSFFFQSCPAVAANRDLDVDLLQIITKSGRKLFPIMQLKVRGLDTQRMYSVVMDFQQKGQNRWKFCDGGWTHAGKAEPAPTDTAYVHTRSPNYGHVWMSDPIDFSKIKVTNKATKDMVREIC